MKAVKILLSLLMISLSLKATVSDYSFSTGSGIYNSLSTEVILVSGGISEYISPSIAIPPFVFNDITYYSLFVSLNGFITFGIIPPSNTYSPIWSQDNYDGAISAFGESLVGNANSKISYNTDDNGDIVIQWENITSYLANHIISFQIRLSTITNTIKIIYGGSTINPNGSVNVEVGLRGKSNTDFNNRILAPDWNNTAPGNSIYSACPVNSSTFPTSGLEFTFKPPKFSFFTATTEMPNAIYLRWNCADTSLSNQYLIVYNTIPSFGSPSGSYIVNDEIQGGGTVIYLGNDSIYHHTGLDPNMTYYYKIWVVESLGYSGSRSCNGRTWCLGTDSLDEKFDYSGVFPECWNKSVNCSGNIAVIQISSYDFHSSPNSIYMNNGSDSLASMVLVTPYIEPDLNLMQIKFYAKGLKSFQNMIIGTMTDPNDISTFNAFSEITLTDYFKLHTISLNTYSGTAHFVAFKPVIDGTYNIIFVDDIIIDKIKPGPVFSVTPASSNFNSVITGNVSVTKTFTITNKGTGDMLINSLLKTGINSSEFYLSYSTPLPVTVGTGESVSFEVYFKPVNTGNKSASIKITVQLEATTNHFVQLSGSGVALNVTDIIYISSDGSGLKDGTSWANSIAGNDTAINGYSRLAYLIQSSSPGKNLWLKSGIYFPCTDNDRSKSFSPTESINIYGGFVGNESNLNQRDTNLYSEFSGNIGLQNDSTDNTYSIFILNNDVGDKVVMDQIMFKNCSHSALINSGDIFLKRCKFSHNFWDDYNGPGSSCITNNDTIEILNCTFNDNTFLPPTSNLSLFSSGIKINSGYCYLSKSHVYNNYSGGYGFIHNSGDCNIEKSYFHDNYTGFIPSGGSVIIVVSSSDYSSPITNHGIMKINQTVIYKNGSSRAGAIVNSGIITVTSSKILNENFNHLRYGSIISCKGGYATFINCLCANNQSIESSTAYSIIQNDGGILTFYNSTITNNKTSGYFIRTGQNSLTSLKNCILWGNQGSIANSFFLMSGFIPSNGTTNIDNSCISGGYEGSGNISDNPLFINPTPGSGGQYLALNSNWKPKLCSPCIDAGADDYCITQKDLNNEARKINVVDQGAYEIDYLNIFASISASNISRTKLNLNSFISNNPCATLLFIKDTLSGNPVLHADSNYIPNAIFGTGSSVNGWFCIANGTNNNLNLTGLTEGTTYRVAAFYYLGEAYHLAGIKNFTTEKIEFGDIEKIYGDNPFILNSVVASSGITAFTYEISDPDIASVNGNILTIHNSGITTIKAKHGATGSYLADSAVAQLIIDKAELFFNANNYMKFCGENNPTFEYDISGFVYSDSINILDSLPQIICTATTESPPGVYNIEFSDGEDNNYIYQFTNGTLTVLNIPVTINGPDTVKFCQGSEVPLVATSITGASYQWLLNDLILPGENDSSIYVSQEGKYSVVATMNGICPNQSPPVVLIEVPLPDNSVTINGNTAFCTGDSTELQVLTQSGYTYQWEKNGNEIPGETSPVLTVNSSGFYSVQITNEYFCTTTSQPIEIIVHNLPDLQFDDPGDSICFNSLPILLNANPPGGIFTGEGVTDQYFIANLAGEGNHIITYFYSDSNQCTNTITQDVNVSPETNVFIGNDTVICDNHFITLDAGANFSEYLWKNGETSQTVIIDSSGTGSGTISVWVQVLDEFGCFASDTINITFTPCTSLINYSENGQLVVYPNPAKNETVIHMNNIKQLESLHFFNLLGEKISLQFNIVHQNPDLLKLNLESLPTGIYFLSLHADNKILTSKITIIQ
ncbi:MAG: MBG domain-containing protein [Bacteroidales bacterium]